VKTTYGARRKRRPKGRYILAVIAVLVVFGLVNSGRSLVQIFRLSQMKTEEKKAGADLERKKTRLQLEIYRLMNDSLYIEEIARREYGMVKRGEEVFNSSPPDTTHGKKADVTGK
jgi:cell division protein FtsB